jgi:hypothetical protein
MATALATRIAALGLWAIAIAERSGSAATELIERGIMPPIGTGHPVEVFTACGIGAFEHLLNADMMPPNMKIRMRLQFKPMPHLHKVDMWENDAGDRRVVTLYSPDLDLYLTVCLGTDKMKRPIECHGPFEAKLAHDTLIRMVKAGQL